MHISVSPYQCLGEKFYQPHQQQDKLFRLFRRPGVGRMALFVQTAFVADAYRATVPRAAVRTHFQQTAMLRHGAVTADVEMIAYCSETAGLVITKQLLGSIVAVAPGGATVEDEVFHRFASLHHRSVLYGEELALVQHLVLTDHHRKCFLYHINNLNKCAATGYAQSGEGGDGCLNDGLDYLLPRDFIILAHVILCF